MLPVIQHGWDLSITQAEQLQRELAARVVTTDEIGAVTRIAGVDVAYAKDGTTVSAAVVVIDADSFTVIETGTATDMVRFPYVPGLFSFRELPPLVQALATLRQIPDLVICDGQGVAHPRGCGLASHLGVIFGLPTIGCGKTRLIGEHPAVAQQRGAQAPLMLDQRPVGAALRTQDGINPLYISSGHRISLATACAWILRLAPTYRLPEPIRLADQESRRALLG